MCNLLLLLLLLLLLASAASGQHSLVIAIEDGPLYEELTLIASSPARRQENLANLKNFDVKFIHLPLSGALENVSAVAQVKQQLSDSGCHAIISDYYDSVAIAALSFVPPLPLFIIRKKVSSFAPTSVNLFEIEIDNFHLSHALYDLSRYYKCTSFTIVSDSSPASSHFLVHFQEKEFKLNAITSNSSTAEIFQIFSSQSPNNVPSGQAWILLFTEANAGLMRRALAEAARAGILTTAQYFFIPSLFIKEPSLSNFYRSDSEFYTFGLPNLYKFTSSNTNSSRNLPFALDCLNHFALSYTKWLSTGGQLLQVISSVTMTNNSLSGKFAYSAATRVRAGVQLQVLRSNSSGHVTNFLTLDGWWSEEGKTPFQPVYSRDSDISRSLVRFAAVVTEPYLYYDLRGFTTGLGLELIKEMSSALGFDYQIVIANDSTFGYKVANNTWTGLMKLLHENKADVTLNFMLPRTERLEISEASVDLAKDGIQMLMRKVIHPFDFLHAFYPFSPYVWLSIVLAVLMLSVTLFVSDKISPNIRGDKLNSSTRTRPMFTLFESFFLVFSSFLMSKVETRPKKLSSRLFTLVLWFSTLMYVTSYLSNLVAFLVKPDDLLPFSTLEELQTTSGYKWAFVRGSSVVQDVEKFWPQLYFRAQQEWPTEMFVADFDEAVRKVLDDPKFVVIASSDSLSFVKSRDCKLRVIGTVALPHYLTLLFRQGFRFKNQLDQQLRSLKNNQLIRLRSKYFDLSRCYTGKIDVENKTQLGYNYLCGLFLFLGIGIVLGFFQILLKRAIRSLRDLCRRTWKKRMDPGKEFQAEVLRVTKDGLWVRVAGQSEVHFLSNSSLYPNATGATNAHCLGLGVGDEIGLHYYGTDNATGAKHFVRCAKDDDHLSIANTLYNESVI